jgi:predicted protein tyrosine phosphatase
MSPDAGTGDNSIHNLVVLSRRQAVQHRGDAPYVVISIRSPGDSIPKLRVDPFRIARINLALHDTLPEWEARSHQPVPVMTIGDAQRIARFIAHYWERCRIVVHCRLGVSRSAGIAAGVLDALSSDANPYENAPYEPNRHFRQLIRGALAPYVTAGRLQLGAPETSVTD